jgi:hypothetical protein
MLIVLIVIAVLLAGILSALLYIGSILFFFQSVWLRENKAQSLAAWYDGNRQSGED